MTSFIIHFLLCNFLISGMIGVLFLVKKQFKKYLTSRTQYNLWFLLLGVMTVPFLPVSSNFSLFSWIPDFQNVTSPDNPASNTISALNTPVTAVNWMNDFSVSVSSQTPSVIRMILFSIWIIGMLAMILLVLKSSFRLHRIKKSALPLQNRNVQNLYHKCCKELNIVKDIPIYSTAFFTSPVMTGSIKPCIYLPIHLISDYKPEPAASMDRIPADGLSVLLKQQKIPISLLPIFRLNAMLQEVWRRKYPYPFFLIKISGNIYAKTP